jgi:hypothetical protein
MEKHDMPTRRTYSTSARRTTTGRTGSAAYSGRSAFGAGYGRTGGSFGGYGAARTTSTVTGDTWPTSSPKFATVRDECAWRIGSYRSIYSQVTGSGTTPAFSPTVAQRWVRFVNTGTPVYKFTAVQFARNFGAQFNTAAPTAAFRFLRGKFGTGIKAVTRGKGGVWLVAATPRVTARPFRNYSWT